MAIKLHRRAFLSLAGGLVMGRAMAGMSLSRSSKYFFSANDQAGGMHFLSRIDWQTRQRIDLSLDFRAHDVLPLNPREVIAFGRRPAMQCVQADFASKEVRYFTAPSGRHFYGHGCLSKDRSVLFTTENDYEHAKGVIGVWDVLSHKKLGEYSSYGIGPHDIQLMPGGQTLVVANGGIQTHPDFGRRKLNLATMQPSLVYIDVHSGKLLGEYRLDDHLLSIRHLTITATGDVGAALQYQGDIYRQQPQSLVAWQKQGGKLAPLEIPEDSLSRCLGYMADLAYDPDKHLLAVTSPRGNCVVFWDCSNGRYITEVSAPEVSGISYLGENGDFLASTGKGELLEIREESNKFAVRSALQAKTTQWDNHLALWQ